MKIRPLEKQFEPKKVAEIKKIQKDFENLRLTLKGESMRKTAARRVVGG